MRSICVDCSFRKNPRCDYRFRIVEIRQKITANANYPRSAIVVCCGRSKPRPYGTPKSEYAFQITHHPKSYLRKILSCAKHAINFANGRSSDTVPTKPDANHIFDRDVIEVERYIQHFAQSALSRSAACVYGAHICADDFGIFLDNSANFDSPSVSFADSSPYTGEPRRLRRLHYTPAKRELCSLKFFGSFFQERTLP